MTKLSYFFEVFFVKVFLFIVNVLFLIKKSFIFLFCLKHKIFSTPLPRGCQVLYFVNDVGPLISLFFPHCSCTYLLSLLCLFSICPRGQFRKGKLVGIQVRLVHAYYISIEKICKSTEQIKISEFLTINNQALSV